MLFNTFLLNCYSGLTQENPCGSLKTIFKEKNKNISWYFVVVSSPDSLLEGESISYSCLPGYQRSNTELTCMDGILLPGQPECWLGSPSSLPALEPSLPAKQQPVYPVHQSFVNPKLKVSWKHQITVEFCFLNFLRLYMHFIIRVK